RRDVADGVHRERLRCGLGDRGLPVHPRHPGAAAEHPPVPEGGVVAAAAETVASAPVVEESLATRILRVLGKLPVQIFLIAVALLWLVPTLGLFVTSVLPARPFAPRRRVRGVR